MTPTTLPNCSHINNQVHAKFKKKQDHQALLKAKYCPRLATASCTHQNTKKTHVTLTFDRWPWNSIGL